MSRLFRASVSGTVTSPRNLVSRSSSTSSASTSRPQESSDVTTHWLILIPYRSDAHGFNFQPIVKECRDDETRFVLTRGSGNGLAVNLNAEATGIRFPSKVVSRNHAEIWRENGDEFYVRDTSSTSGTFLNNKRLSDSGTASPAFPLKDGDKLKLGVNYDGGREMLYRAVEIRVMIGPGRKYRGSAATRRESPGNVQNPVEYTPDATLDYVPVEPCSSPILEDFPNSPLSDGPFEGYPPMGAENSRPEVEAYPFATIHSHPNPAVTNDGELPRYRTPSPPSFPDETPSTSQITGFQEDDELFRYASHNRQAISVELENKLRRAHYMPEDDPNEISAQEWQSEFGVGFFELKRLKELYLRNFGNRGR